MTFLDALGLLLIQAVLLYFVVESAMRRALWRDRVAASLPPSPPDKKVPSWASVGLIVVGLVVLIFGGFVIAARF